MLEGITPSQDTTGTNDLDFRFEALVKGMDIGQSRRLDILAANTTKTIFRTDNDRLILDVKTISNRIDTVDKSQRVLIENRSSLVKMHDVKVRRQLDT